MLGRHHRFDSPDAQLAGKAVKLSIAVIHMLISGYQRANRMRTMVPTRTAEGLDVADLARPMQAHFDTALDAR